MAAIAMMAGLAPHTAATVTVPAERVATELPAPAGSTNAQAAAINDSGLIVGWAQVYYGPAHGWSPHAAIWTPAAAPGQPPVARLLPDAGGSSDHGSKALGVNGAGRIVGWSTAFTKGSTAGHAVVWAPPSHGVYADPIDLGTQVRGSDFPTNLPASMALAINSAGEIAGCAGTPIDGCGDSPTFFDEFFDARAVLWTPAPEGGYAQRYIDASADATSPGGSITKRHGSRATGINDSGEIAGEILNPPPIDASLTSVNVGGYGPQSVNAEVSRQAVVWTPRPVAVAEVPTVPNLSVAASIPYTRSRLKSSSDGSSSEATGINRSGQVVGTIDDHAVVWTPSAPLLTLPAAPTPPGQPVPTLAPSPAPSVSANQPESVPSPYATALLPETATATSSQGLAINEAGEVAGFERFGGTPGASFSVTWMPPATPGETYGPPVLTAVYGDGPYSQAAGINTLGTMVGDVHPLSFNPEQDLLEFHAALWLTTTVPGAPDMFTAAPDDGQAIVYFNPPSTNGGSPITSYTVTSSPGGITASGIGSPITVTGLTNGRRYSFTATATNAVGTGPPSLRSNVVTPIGPWQPGDRGAPPATITQGRIFGLPPLDAAISRLFTDSGDPASAPAVGSAPAAAPVAPKPRVALAGSLVAGTWAGHPRVPSRIGGGGGRSGSPEDDFLLMLTALVMTPATMLVAAWMCWQRGWVASVRRRLAGRRAGASAW